jgi:hypothetical protein
MHGIPEIVVEILSTVRAANPVSRAVPEALCLTSMKAEKEASCDRLL